MILFIMIAAISFIWVLLSQGLLWKIIVGIFGWLGMYWALVSNFPASNTIFFESAHNSFSWAQVIPTIVLVLAMFYTKE